MKIENRSLHSKGNLKWEIICRKLSRSLPQEIFDEWVKQFEWVEAGERTVRVVYPERMDIEEFRVQYGDIFNECLSWAYNRRMEADFRPGPAKIERNKDRRIWKRRQTDSHINGKKVKILKVVCWGTVYLSVSLLLLIGINWIFGRTYEKTFYSLTSDKTQGGIRIVQLSDLNGSEYGDENNKLIETVGLLDPDIVVFSGNMAGSNKNSLEKIVEFSRTMTEIAPICYIYGESEKELEENGESSLMQALESVGVQVLIDCAWCVETDGGMVDIFGFSPAESYEQAQVSEVYEEFLMDNEEHIKISVVNSPGFLEKSANTTWGDLILCGGRQGGGIRLPLVGALYDRENGFFPEKIRKAYMSGEYRKDSTPLIVSRGIGKNNLRIQNIPELVVIDITQY